MIVLRPRIHEDDGVCLCQLQTVRGKVKQNRQEMFSLWL